MTKLGLFPVAAFLILDNEGKVLLSKYYSEALKAAYPRQGKKKTMEEPNSLETLLHTRIQDHPDNEIILMDDGRVALYRVNLDVTVIVVGESDANELLLADLLEAFFEVMLEVLKPQIDKKILLEHYDQILLTLDEMIERGIILELDGKEVLGRVQKPTLMSQLGELPVNEATLQSAFQLAKDQFKTFIRG